MILNGKMTVVGKFTTEYVDNSGNAKISHSLNILQDNGRVIGTIKVSADQFQLSKENQEYNFIFSTGTGKNGLYLKLLEILPVE